MHGNSNIKLNVNIKTFFERASRQGWNRSTMKMATALSSETLLTINKFTGCRNLKNKYKKNIYFAQRKVPDRESDMPVESSTLPCVFSLSRNSANYFLAKHTTLHACH